MPQMYGVDYKLIQSTAADIITAFNSVHQLNVTFKINRFGSGYRGRYDHDIKSIELCQKEFRDISQVVATLRHELWHALQWKNNSSIMNQHQEFLLWLGDHTGGISYLLYWLNPVENAARFFGYKTSSLTTIPQILRQAEQEVQEYRYLLVNEGVLLTVNTLVPLLDEDILRKELLQYRFPTLEDRLLYHRHNHDDNTSLERLGLRW